MTLFAPNFRCPTFALNIVRIESTGILDFNHGLPSILVFHKKIWDVSPPMPLAVDPRNNDAVSLHPFDNMRVVLKAIHHPALKFAVETLKTPRTLLRILVVAAFANRHIR